MIGRKSNNNLIKNDQGFSTVMDIFLFLTMVSISAVILLPSITGNIQVKSVIESKNQERSSGVLLTLLNGRVDKFEYIVAGEQMDAIAGDPVNKSSLYTSAKKLFAGHEMRHRTFADLAAESAASQWVVYNNGKRIRLNFLMKDQSNNLDRVLENYLDEQVGDMYDYNFTVVWRPFVDAPVGGDVSIGEPVPDNAFTESTYVTMPYYVNFTRKRVEGIVDTQFNSSSGNISTFFNEIGGNGTNRSLVEKEIAKEINELINSTIDDAVAEVVSMSLEPVLDRSQSTVIDQVDNLLNNDSSLLNNIIKDGINETLLGENFSANGTMSARLTLYLQDTARKEIHEMADDDINFLVTELADMYVSNVISIQGIKERIISEICQRISINRAQATLSIWEKNA